MANISQSTSDTTVPEAVPEPTPVTATASYEETSVLPSFAPDETRDEASDRAGSDEVAPKTSRPSWFAAQPMRLMLVVIIGVVALFFAFGLLIIFSPSNAAVAALAVIATPIAVMVAAYFGITFSIQQVKAERAEKEAAVARLAAAETAAREADVWAAQMESGLRVAMVKLEAARITSKDVAKAAGVEPDFF